MVVEWVDGVRDRNDEEYLLILCQPHAMILYKFYCIVGNIQDTFCNFNQNAVLKMLFK